MLAFTRRFERNCIRSFLISKSQHQYGLINFYSDDERERPKKSKSSKEYRKKDLDENKNEAVNRLNKLLASMQTDSNAALVKSVIIPKAGGRKKQREEEKTKLSEEKKSSDIMEAIKEAAEAVSGDKKQIESELLSKLLNQPAVSTGEMDSQEEQPVNVSNFSLSEIISGMKIDRSEKHSSQSRAQFVRRVLDKRTDSSSGNKKQFTKRRYTPQQHESSGSVDLFGSEPLGIFTKNNNLQDSTEILKTWDKLQERENKLAVTHPPSNYFQKMALWTDQGKLWKFPIDNEQGLEDEAKVDFADHVFLEHHLEPWCPTKGPIRHFMDLVCIGLSKNPYIKVDDKIEHINWFRDYFESKKDILAEVIVQEEAKMPQLENTEKKAN